MLAVAGWGVTVTPLFWVSAGSFCTCISLAPLPAFAHWAEVGGLRPILAGPRWAPRATLRAQCASLPPPGPPWCSIRRGGGTAWVVLRCACEPSEAGTDRSSSLGRRGYGDRLVPPVGVVVGEPRPEQSSSKRSCSSLPREDGGCGRECPSARAAGGLTAAWAA